MHSELSALHVHVCTYIEYPKKYVNGHGSCDVQKA